MLYIGADKSSGGEGMVWTREGIQMHGLTGGHWRNRRAEFIIPRTWEAGVEHIL